MTIRRKKRVSSFAEVSSRCVIVHRYLELPRRKCILTKVLFLNELCPMTKLHG